MRLSSDFQSHSEERQDSQIIFYFGKKQKRQVTNKNEGKKKKLKIYQIIKGQQWAGQLLTSMVALDTQEIHTHLPQISS